MGDAWRETVVALVTEFGRTAHINGSDGTDYGTATAALFAGGALKGERVIADWPGLKETDLQDKRDLKPTTDLRSVLKGLLRDHLHVNQGHLEATVFPDSTAGGRVGFHSKRARHSLSNPVRRSNDARGNGRYGAIEQGQSY